MSSWRICGHEAFGSETECLRCRIFELQAQLNDCGTWAFHMCIAHGGLEAQLKAVRELPDKWRDFASNYSLPQAIKELEAAAKEPE